jgi:hypothetical protein
MTIRANIKQVRKKILLEVIEEDKPFTREVQDKAVEAILNGMSSPQCRTYMAMFADPTKPQQLERLMAEDGTVADPAKRRARAYLVSNGPCGTDTVTTFENGVSDALDVDLTD